MFEECLDVFKRELEDDSNLILDEYIPSRWLIYNCG